MNSESIALQKPSPVSAAVHRPAQWAGLAALGVVFGDLGTSPLYTLQTIVQSMGGHFTPGEALGILSLVIWTLLITISIKYCLFVMRADNHGEGGILALMSLIRANSLKGHARAYAVMGLLGAALIYGDGVITPAISVLSALEGVNAASDQFKPFVMPAAVVILVGLFASQRLGTERIGRAFGPIMLLWFGVIALLGVVAIFAHPEVMIALDPRHALKFVLHKGNHGLLVLGGVFLCITGGEALYADMGHFGRRPIRGAWYTIVLPALLLSYAGQTAYVMEKGSVTGNPFFLIAPAWSIYPLVALATVATIIASQAIITGSFSMTRQAMQLGWLPGVSIRQTSDRVYGQIYVPVVNWLLMVATVAVTVGFGSSDRLAGAYGTAVSTTMLLTTALLYRAMRRQWRWRASVALGVAGMFLLVDASFFGANLLKIAEGGWLPLTFAALLFMVMVTWRTGRDAMHAAQSQPHQAAERFMEELRNGAIARIDGTAVFLTRSRQRIARLIIDHAHFTHVLPKQTVALSIVFEETPRIEGPNCVIVDEVGEGIWHFLARFGFFEIPNLRQALERTCCAELGIDLEHARFIASRDLVVSKPSRSVFSPWRMALFAFLWRNSVKIVDRFNLEPDRTVEIARQVEI